MNKKDWKEGLGRLVKNLEMAGKNLEVSKKNVIIIEGQQEETEFMISAYKDKIKTFK